MGPLQSWDVVMYIQGIVKSLLFHCLQGFLAAILWFRVTISAPNFPGRTSLIYLFIYLFFIKPNDVILGIPFLPRHSHMRRLLLYSQQGTEGM